MPTIRINAKDKNKLDEICRKTDLSQPDVFHWAIGALEKERMAKQLESDFGALAADSEALRDYKSESKVFDQASADGLI